MLEMKLDELDAAREWMTLLGRKNAHERVVSLLVMFARRNLTRSGRLETGRVEIDILLTRAAIGDFLGLTLETVSRQMTRLKNEGHIEFGIGHRIVIRDFQSFFSLAGYEEDGGIIS